MSTAIDPPVIKESVLINGIQTLLVFSRCGMFRWTEDGYLRMLCIERHVLGFVRDGSKVRINLLLEFNYRCCCLGSKRSLDIRAFEFEPLSDEAIQHWCSVIQNKIDSLGRPKRLYIFVNPYSGKNSASKIFLDDVKPILEDSNIEFTVQETEHQLHAKEISSCLDLSKYDGIVCIGGDGTLVEVVNGLLEREDWAAAIKMPIGIIPAGTGNGMIKSLLDSAGHPCTPSDATHMIIRGHKRSLDVATIAQGQTRFFSVLMLAWGLIADIDIESEKYRWMGSARLDFYAIKRVLNLRKYNGYISFIPAPGFEKYGDPKNEFSGENILNASQVVPGGNPPHRYHGANTSLEKMEWRTISGPFVSVWLHNVPWGSEDTMAAPDAKFSDGFLDLILIRDCSKLSLIKILGGLDTGNHVNSPHVMYLKVKAVHLKPGMLMEDPAKGGIIDVDGEAVARGEGTYKCDQKTLMVYDQLRVTVDQGLATLFAPL